MKKSNFYILLFSNLLIFIGVAISLFILVNSSSSINFKPEWLLIAPLVAMVFSGLIIAWFQIRVYADLKYRIFHTNPKLFNMVKNIGYVSLFNNLFPIIFVIFAASLKIVGASDYDAYIMRLSLLISALVVSGFFGILTTTFFTYINYRISFDEERRKSISKEVDIHNEEIIENSEEVYQHSDKYNDMDSEKQVDDE